MALGTFSRASVSPWTAAKQRASHPTGELAATKVRKKQRLLLAGVAGVGLVLSSFWIFGGDDKASRRRRRREGRGVDQGSGEPQPLPAGVDGALRKPVPVDGEPAEVGERPAATAWTALAAQVEL
jgi:hypothetical protein